MEIPVHIDEQIKRIQQMEQIWKYQFSTSWTFGVWVDKETAGKPERLQTYSIELPASRRGTPDAGYYRFKTAQELVDVGIKRDPEMTMDHVITMFVLLEALVKRTHKLIEKKQDDSFLTRILNKKCGKKTEITDIKPMVKFLRKYGFLDEKDVTSFELAKYTRNHLVHTGYKVDKESRWLDTYKRRKYYSIIKEIFDRLHDPAPEREPTSLKNIINMPVVESWNDIIVEIANIIETYIKNLPNR